MTRTNDQVALDEWYAVAFTAEIPKGSSETTTLLGQNLTIHRGWDGAFQCVLSEGASETPPEIGRAHV